MGPKIRGALGSRAGSRRIALGSLVVALFLAQASAAQASAPINLVLPQSSAFAILGHSCGGIQEQSVPTGFDASGYPTGVVSLKTTCSSGGRGSHPIVYTGSASVIWNFGGNVNSYTSPAGAPGPNSPSSDSNGDQLSSSGAYATLTDVAPAAPNLSIPAQSGDQAQVSWTPSPSPPWVVSSTVTATPQGSSAPVVTVTVGGSATSALVGPLQPATTYAITAVSSNAGGSSPASNSQTLTTKVSTVPPKAPTAVSAYWTAPGAGASDSLVASWAAPAPGDSPIDQYQVKISIYGGDITGSHTQTVSGSTLGTTFVNVDDTWDWAVVVRAHNAAGWGHWSTRYILGGA